MDDKYIKDIYENLGGESVFGKYDDYYSLITSDDDYAKDVYSNLGGESVFGNYDDFSSLVKKKGQSDSASPADIMESTTKEREQNFSLGLLKKDEDEAKPLLLDKLTGKGYSVETTGIGDALNVTDNITGEVTEIDLQPFTDSGTSEELSKINKLLNSVSDSKRSLLSTNNKEDFDSDVDSYIENLKSKYSNFNIESVDKENIRISKGDKSQVFKVKNVIDGGSNIMTGAYTPDQVSANDEGFSQVNKFLYENINDDEALSLNSKLGLNTFKFVEEGLKNIESTVDVSVEAAEAEVYNKEYFKGLFDFLESNGVAIPEEAKNNLSRGTKSTVTTRNKRVRQIPLTKEEIQQNIQKYFGENLDMINAYDISKIVSVRKQKINRAKKLKTEIFYDSLPNKEEVKEVLRQSRKNITEEELDITANVKLAENDIKKMYNGLSNDIKNIKKNNPNAKFTPLYDDNGMLIDITSDTPIKELDELNKRVRASFKNYSDLYEVSKYKLEKLAAKKGTTDEFMDASNRNYDLIDNAMADLKNAAIQLGGGLAIIQTLAEGAVEDVVGVPVSFGSTIPMSADLKMKLIRGEMKESREKIENFFETRRTYDEALEEGSVGRFSTLTFAQQAPNIALAIGTSGTGTALGLGKLGTQLLIGTQFGLTSSGQKYDELTTRQEFGNIAKKGLKELEELKGIIPDKEYLIQKYELERALKDSEISSADKTLSVIGTGIVEGSITSFLGTAPNSIKVLKDLKNVKSVNFIKDILKSNYKAAGSALKELGKRTGGEVLEEGSIDALTQVNDYLFLGDQIDLSTLDDTAVTSIITSGTMNTPSIAYSTILKQINVNRYKNAIQEKTKQIQSLKDILNDTDMSDLQRSSIHNSINSVISSIADETTAMEGDALLMGADSIREMLTLNGVKDNMLKKAEVEFDDSYEVARTKVDNYLSTLSEGDAKKFIDQMKYIDNTRNKLLGNIKYEGAVAKVFGEKGKEIANKLDPTLTPKQKYVEVYKQIRQEINENALEEFNALQNEKESKPKADNTQKEQIEKFRQQEIEEVELAIARSNETGEIPVVRGQAINTSTIDNINKKYDNQLQVDTETAQYLIDLKSTKDSDPTTYWSVGTVSVGVAESGTVIDTEDGSSLVKDDGDIIGLFKKPTSKTKGVAQDLLKKSVEAGGVKLDNFDGYLTKQYEKAGFRVVARTPFNKKFAPDGWNQEKHGTPDVVAMIYDPESKLNIEEKMFDDIENGYEQMIDYRDSLLSKPEVTEKTTEKEIQKDIVDNNLESFANRIIEGGIDNFSDEALQFYAENKDAIDNLVKEKQKKVPKDNSNIRRLAVRIADGQQNFSDADIDLFAANEQKVREEADTIAKTRGIQIKSDNYKNIIKSTKRPRKIVVTDEYAALKDQIRLEARAAREAKKDYKNKLKELAGKVKALMKSGSISTKQAELITRRLANLNIDNPKMVNRFIDYMDKVYNDADYQNKLTNANKLRKKIRRLSKNNEATLVEVSNTFKNIDPSKVNNIEQYIEKAESLVEGLTKSNRRKISSAVSISNIKSYIETIEKEILDNKRKEFTEATGLKSEDLSYDEMMSILYSQESSEDKILESKEKEIRKGIKEAFKYYLNDLNKLIQGIDPSNPGEKIEIKDKNLLKKFSEIDLDEMKTSTMLSALDALINVTTNPEATGGIGKIVSRNEGKNNAKDVVNKGIVADKLGTVGRLWNKYISTANMMFEQLFVGQSKAEFVENKSGFSKLAFDYTKADKIADKLFAKYNNKFNKQKANNKKFFENENIFERAIIARVQRTIEGSEKSEFQRQKSLIEQSYKKLKENGDDKAVILENLYNKLLEGSNNVDDVLAKADKVNVDAVSEMQSIWSEVLPQLKDVSLNYYNQVLSEDSFYTPDFFDKMEEVSEIEDLEVSNFGDTSKAVYDKKTGTLNKNQRTKKIDKFVVSFDFDFRNQTALRDALRDINSAATIQEIVGFINSKSYKKIFPNDASGQILRERLVNYSKIKRNKDFINKDSREVNKIMNRISKIGVARALATIFQPIKQVVPVLFNTAVNLGDKMYLLPKAIRLYLTKKDVRDFIDRTNAPVTQRGIGSVTTLDSAESQIKSSKDNNLNKFLKPFSKISEWGLNNVLVKPDVFAAKVSFLAYYLERDNVSNFKDAEPKQEAAMYAERKVSRTQNTSDEAMQGDFFSNKNSSVQFIRKTLFPFANFSMNQKTRVYADFKVLSKARSQNKQDVVSALTSSFGTLTEMMVFHTIGYYITSFLTNMAYSLIGYYEDDEEKKKRVRNQLKGKLTSIATDYLSPIPFTNPTIASSINFILRNVQSGDDVFQLFSNDEMSFTQRMGVLGISVDKAGKIFELTSMIVNRTYTDNFGREKEISSEGVNNLEKVLIPYLMYSLGLLPGEAGYMSEKIIKVSKKMKDNSIPLISIEDNKEILGTSTLKKGGLKKSSLKKSKRK